MTLSRLLALTAALASFAILSPAFADDKEKSPVTKTPEECYAQFKKSLLASDADAVWNLLAKGSQKALCLNAQDDKEHFVAERSKELGVTEEEFAKLEPREIALRGILAKIDDAAKKRLAAETLEELKVDRKKAHGVRVSGENKREIDFVKEGETWVISLTAGCDGGDEEGEDEEREVATTPELAAKQFEAALRKKDKPRVWALISSESQKVLEAQVGNSMMLAEGEELTELAEELGVTVEEYKKLSAKDLVVAMLVAKFNAQSSDKARTLSIKDVKIEGDKAEGKTAFGDEEPRTSHFIKEDGEWKFDVKSDMEAVEKKVQRNPGEEDGGGDK